MLSAYIITLDQHISLQLVPFHLVESKFPKRRTTKENKQNKTMFSWDHKNKAAKSRYREQTEAHLQEQSKDKQK